MYMNFGRGAEFNEFMIHAVENKDPSQWPKLPQNDINIPAYDDYTYFGEVSETGKFIWPIGWGILEHKHTGLKIACEFTGPRLTPHEHVIFAFPNGLRFTAKTFNKFQIIEIKKILNEGNSPLELDKIQPFLLENKTKLDETFFQAINGTNGSYTMTDIKFPSGIAPASGGIRRFELPKLAVFKGPQDKGSVTQTKYFGPPYFNVRKPLPYYGFFNETGIPTRGTVVDTQGVELYSDEWETRFSNSPSNMTITFTFTNGLKIQTQTDQNFRILEFNEIYNWGTSRLKLDELFPFVSGRYDVTYTRDFYKAIDVVDSGKGDNVLHNLEFLKQYTGQVIVISWGKQRYLENVSFTIPVTLTELYEGYDPDFGDGGYEHRVLKLLYDDIRLESQELKNVSKTKITEEGKEINEVCFFSEPNFNFLDVGYLVDGKWQYTNLFAVYEPAIMQAKLGAITLSKMFKEVFPLCNSCTLIHSADFKMQNGGRKRHRSKKRKSKKRSKKAKSKKLL